jgi:hypothetical protein
MKANARHRAALGPHILSTVRRMATSHTLEGATAKINDEARGAVCIEIEAVEADPAPRADGGYWARAFASTSAVPPPKRHASYRGIAKQPNSGTTVRSFILRWIRMPLLRKFTFTCRVSRSFRQS